jgi:O-antigen/teichoic acid export membrane protein
MAVANICGVVAGRSLSNLVIRHYGNSKDNLGREGHKVETFNGLALIIVPVFLLLGSFALWALDEPLHPAFIVIAGALSAKNYLLSECKLRMNYRLIAGINLGSIVGAMTGLGVFMMTDSVSPLWIFAISESVGLVIAGATSSYTSSGVCISSETPRLLRQYCGLAFSGLSNNAMTYGDRIILTTIASPAVVGVFFAAALGGRMSQMAINMIAGVLVAQLALIRRGGLRNAFNVMLIAAALFCAIAYIVLSAAMPMVLQLLYPQFLTQALEVLNVINMAFSIKLVELILRPMMIRVAPLRTMAMLDGSVAVLYLAAAAFGASIYGIMGLAYALLGVVALRLVLEIVVLKRALAACRKGD